MGQLPEKKNVAVDVNEFIRTRDALSSAYMSLSSSIDRAVKAYIDHTNVVLAGDGSLNVSFLTQPFDQLAHTAQIAQQALHGAQQIQQNGTVAGAQAEDGTKKKKRAYKQRDPNAPKRPLTAYFRYLQEQRGPLGEEMKAAAGGQPQKPGDLSKEATERWNKLGKEDQQPYRDAYQRALKDYEKDVAKYKAVDGKVEEAPTPAEDVEVEPEQHDQVVEEEEDDDADADEEDDDEEDEDEDEDEDEPAPPPPPAPKATSPETQKKTPKSAMKKTNVPAAAAPTPVSSSPERKRKAPATSSDATEAEPAGRKKRGRKSNVEKAAMNAESEPATVAPVAKMVGTEAQEPAKKKKKKKADS